MPATRVAHAGTDADGDGTPLQPRPSLVLGVLARGQRSLVVRAIVDGMQQPVAAKLPLAADGAEREQRAREFERERAMLDVVSGHPGIVRAHDRFDRLGAIVLDLLAGGDARSRLECTGPWPEARVLAFLADVGSALAHVHERGVVHGDVKPSNVCLDAHDRPVLIDFGEAVSIGEPRPSPRCSLAYAAPEIVAHAAPSPASDVYSLGATAFQLLTGRRFERSIDDVDELAVTPITRRLIGSMLDVANARPAAHECVARALDVLGGERDAIADPRPTSSHERQQAKDSIRIQAPR